MKTLSKEEAKRMDEVGSLVFLSNQRKLKEEQKRKDKENKDGRR